MENNFDTKYKPLGMRILAAITAFIASLSFIGYPSLSAKAVDNTVSKLTEADEPDEEIQEIDLDADELIIDDFPDVKARYIPLSEEEQAEATKALIASSMKRIKLKANEDGFYYGDLQETANQSMKQFTYRYMFTSPEPYEGDTSNYIERSDNFFVKALLIINTEHILAAGHMEIRVPKYLFPDRNGGYCEVSSLSLSKFKSIPAKDENGVYDVEGKWIESQAPFDYYFDSKTNEYVFVNYDELDSGSNEIQIAYQKADVFDIVNGTEWSVSPKATIIYDMEKTGALFANGSMVGEGTSNAYFTEYVNNSNGELLYMRGVESDTSGDKLNTYCNSQGNPVFVHRVNSNENVNIDEWYDVSYTTTLADAQNLIAGGTLTAAPDITVSTESVLVKRDVFEALSGKVVTDAELTSITKSPEPNNSRGYGAQLYTKGQMSKYINVDNLDLRVLNVTGDKLSSDYIYTCWRVYTKGNCTQPWSMLLEETPRTADYKLDNDNNVVLDAENNPVLKTDENGNIEYRKVDGAIVLGVSTMMQNSYSKRTDTQVKSNSADIQRLKNYVSDLSDKGDYWYVADSNSEMRATFGLQSVVKEHKFDIGYYVVVAYPVSELTKYTDTENTTFYPPFKNEVKAYLIERDGQESDFKTSVSSDNIVFKKFEWTGGDEYWHTYKRVEGECKDGLLSVYDKLVDSGETSYIGDIMFHESYRGGAYMTCHDNSTYKHTNGKYYKVVNTDDVITAQPYGEIKDSDDKIKRVYGKPQVLDGSDYFFSKAVLTLSEFEVDPYEDYEYALDQEAASQKIDSGDSSITRDWIVYGWYEGGTGWEEIDLKKFGCPNSHFTVQDYVELRGKNSLYKITLDFKDKGEPCPYRLKVEHNCIAYNTRMNWDLETQLKLDSPKFQSNESNGSLRTGFYDENGNPVTPTSFEMFRISLRNYSATKATEYNGNTVVKEIIDNFNSSTGKYHNIEGWAERTLVNANRYQWVDMEKMYDDSSYIHCQEAPITKTPLGDALLKAERVESPFGTAEFLPLKYISDDYAATYSDLGEFTKVNRHVYRDHAAIDISILETDAHAEKFASWENDTKNGQVLMTYTLSGFEGYKLSKELRPLIESLGVKAAPVREKIIIYDLLPPGVNYYGFEEPVVGKLTTTKIGDEESETITFDDVENYYDSWDRSKVKLEAVTVDENWEETGRTMVAFTVNFTDTNAVLTESNWFVGCGIRFKAYVSWDNYGPAREKDNIFAYAVHEEDNNNQPYNGGDIYGRFTGTEESQVFDGEGRVVPSNVGESGDYKPFEGKKLENTKKNVENHNRLYGHANDMESVTMARTLGIKKQVIADDNQFAEYEDQTSVVKEHNYTYNIHIDKTAQGAAGDIVIFDKIEAISDAHSGGHGTFVGVDLNEVYRNFSHMEGNIKIWYSESLLSPTALYQSKETGNYYVYPVLTESDVSDLDITERVKWDFDTVNGLVDDEKQWKLLTPDVERSNIKSIAIDFGNTILPDQATLNIYIKMQAPSDISKNFALNEASYYFADYEKTSTGYVRQDTFEYSKSEITVVSFGDERKLDVIKRVIGLVPSELDKKYTFKISSNVKLEEGVYKDYDYSNIQYKLFKPGQDIDDKLIHTTNTDGEFELKDGEKASFESLPALALSSYDNNGVFDFDNYNITEKSAPYWLSVESIFDDPENKTVNFTNYYRPVIYLTKKTKGVPEGDNPNTTFSYKIKVYEGESETPITFSNAAGGYKLLSQTGEHDSRVDNNIYWYKVAGSAGWYEIPQGWNIDDDAHGLYNSVGSAFDNNEKCFTVTFKSGETVAVPIYIQHIVDENDVGMLNDDGTPRYRITIEEVDNREWYCTSAEKSGELGAGENSYIWVNNYMYKELLIKKTVTHAPDDLSGKPFTFKLTKKNGEVYCSNAKSDNINWTLCTMDQSGVITALSGEDKSGTVANDGTFSVTGCGNAAESKGDTYVIKLSYLELEDKGKDAEYTVTEILEPNGDFAAIKGSNTAKIKGAALNSTVEIENDYLKRDITIRKVVAAKTMPSSSYKFTMVLCPENVEGALTNKTVTVVDKNGNKNTITATVTNTPENGWRFQLSEGDSVTFSEIGKVGDRYSLYEAVDSTYLPLSMRFEHNAADTQPEIITLEADKDSELDVINGGDGYVVLRKQFKGDISEISNILDNEDITVKLELRKADGDYIVPVNASSYITVSGTPVFNAENITFKRTDNVIINMAGLIASQSGSFDGSFKVTETLNRNKIQESGNWYVVEPDETDAVWEFGSETKQGVIVNNVTKYAGEDVIYKRIGFKGAAPATPSGNISFTLRDSSGKPVQGVGCVVARYDETERKEVFTDYRCVSDADGIINIDFTDAAVKNDGWMQGESVKQYFLKLYFDRAVKINSSSPAVLSITENTIATDDSWGAPAGYEKFSDEDTYVNARLLKKGQTTHWTIKDADTFVNTQDTEKVAFTKNVNASGTPDPETNEREFTDEDKDTIFRFVVSELIGSSYQPAPHIRYAVYDINDTEMTEPKRTGVTDLDEDDPNTGWGVFTLKGGEKAVLDIPKNAYWQVSEENTGKYKLVTDNDDNITSDDPNAALLADSTSKNNYAAKYIAQGFEFHTTLDMLSGYIEGDDLVIIDGFATAGNPMFAKYVESEDAPNDADGIYRTHTRNGEADNYYYSATDSTDKYNNSEYIINDITFYSTGNAALTHDGSNGLVWSNAGTADAYKGSEVVLPAKVYSHDGENVISHRIVGIGKNAYNGNTGINTVIMPKYVEKIGDNAFKGCTNLRDVIWYGATIASYGGSYPNKYYVTYSDPEDGFGVKVLGAYSLCSTSVDVVLPPTVVTMEAGVFKDYKTAKYGDNKWRNAPPANGVTKANAKYVYKFGEMLPSTLRYFAPNDSGLSDETLGKGAQAVNGNLEIFAGTAGTSSYSNTSHLFISFVIGSGDSISELKTSFDVIGSNSTENDIGVLPLNAFHLNPMRWPTIVIGKNETGITVKSEFNEQFGYHNAAYEGQVIVFPKGLLTLEENCLKNNNGKTYLRILQTDNLADLRVEGFVNDTISSNTKTIYVFTNLTQAQVEGSMQYNKLKSGGSDAKVQFYYKDTISGHYDDIIRDVNMSINFWDKDVRAMLKDLAGPGTLPAPRHLTAPEKVISHNDIYLEKKKELLD